MSDCGGEIAKIELSQKLELMLISAERYAFGRRTHIVFETVNYLAHLLPKVSDWCIAILTNDMKSEFDRAERMGNTGNFGDDCDYQDWVRFRDALTAEAERRKEKVKSMVTKSESGTA